MCKRMAALLVNIQVTLQNNALVDLWYLKDAGSKEK